MRLAQTQTVIKNGKLASAPRSASSYDRQWNIYILALVILDIAAILGGLWIAYALRVQWLEYNGPTNLGDIGYLTLILTSIPLWLLVFKGHGLYDRNNLMGGVAEYQKLPTATAAGVCMVVLVSVFVRETFVDVSRLWLLFSVGCSLITVFLARFAARKTAQALRSLGWFTADVLIVGANDQGMEIARQWRNLSTSGMRVIGFLDDFKPIGTEVLDGIKVIGRPTALAPVAESAGAHEVVVVPNAVAWETFEEIVRGSVLPKNYTLRLSPGFYELLTTSVQVTNKTFVPLLTINEARIVDGDAWLKAVLDYGVAAFAGLISAPIWLVIAVGLWLKGKPVLARYCATGQNGKQFTMYKFNTNYPAHLGSISRFGSLSNPSIGANAPMPFEANESRMERLLYSTGFDKLPQFLNVLAGQMSLVGPRPQVLGGTASDVRELPHLQALKPGMIGPWAVEQVWKLQDEDRDDLFYVRNWTIWLDLSLIWSTLAALPKVLGMARPYVTGGTGSVASAPEQALDVKTAALSSRTQEQTSL